MKGIKFLKPKMASARRQDGRTSGFVPCQITSSRTAPDSFEFGSLRSYMQNQLLLETQSAAGGHGVSVSVSSSWLGGLTGCAVGFFPGRLKLTGWKSKHLLIWII